MMTESVLEQWGVDGEQIVAAARQEVGEGDLYLGGSLADDLGTPSSDVDLYCFVPTGGSGRRRVELVGHRAVMLELHVVDVGHELSTADSLVPLVTMPEPPPPGHWPFLTGASFRAFHALLCDRPLAADHGAAERMRGTLGVDLLPIYVALRASSAASSLALEAAQMAAADSILSALHCARSAVELALDAALAAVGSVSANPKSRLTLARRVGLYSDDGGLVPLAALFPDHRAPDDAVARCQRVTVDLLGLVAGDAFLARYPTVSTAVDRIRAATGARAATGSAAATGAPAVTA